MDADNIKNDNCLQCCKCWIKQFFKKKKNQLIVNQKKVHIGFLITFRQLDKNITVRIY